MSNSLRSFLVIVSLLAILGLGIIGLGSSFLPLLLAFIIAYLLFPVIVRLEKKGVHRNHALLAIFAALTVIVLVVLLVVGPGLVKDSQQFVRDLPKITTKALDQVEIITDRYGIAIDLSREGLKELISDSFDSVSTSTLKSASLAIKGLFTNVTGLLLGVLNLFMIPLFLFYVINDYEKISKYMKILIPKTLQPKLTHYFHLSNNVLSGYIRGQILVAMILALLYSIGLSLIGLKFGFLIGLITGLLSIIPYAGFAIGIVASVLVALANYTSPMIFVGLAIVFTIIQMLEGFLITPKLVGNKVGLSAFATMLALIMGGNLLGLPGMLVAIPFAAILKSVLADLLKEYQELAINQ